MGEPPEARSTAQKIALFRECFTGLTNVYGTYDPADGRVRQVKEPVTDGVILAHLRGQRPYGVYLLVRGRTRALAVDFDAHDLLPAIDFVRQAQHYKIPAYIERSKSKGHHVWTFFSEGGPPAAKARLVARHILTEIGQPQTEVFPKHDSLDTRVTYGNFIFAPLFGALVPGGRTVFVRPENPTQPHPDQWALLEGVERVPERLLDDVIEVNELAGTEPRREPSLPNTPGTKPSTFGLPPCARRMLAEGVCENQRVSCFRLAVDLKRAGLPPDMAAAVLETFARRNRPANGKRTITRAEIHAQVRDAYQGPYRSYGCEDPAIRLFCAPHCPVHNYRRPPSRLSVPMNAKGQSRTSTRSTAMPATTANRPIKEFRVRNLSLAIWQNEGTRDGRPVTLHSVTLNKRYQDQETGEWKNSSSFFPDDLPRLRLLLDKAYEHILLRDTSPAADPDEPGDEFPPSE